MTTLRGFAGAPTDDHNSGVSEDLGFACLAPLGEALAAVLGACAAVATTRLPVAEACGRVAATSVVAPAPVPDRALALRDGWGVAAQDTLGASSYAPVFAMTPPTRLRIGDPLPEATDSVLPLPFVDARAVPCEILGSVAPLDGARGPGGDFSAGALLIDAGDVLRPTHVALLELVGITEVEVRAPCVTIVSTTAAEAVSPAARYIAAEADQEGATSRVDCVSASDLEAIARTLSAHDADLVLVLGDSSCGGTIFRALSAAGEVLVHGIAVRPGETMGCGLLRSATGAGKIPVVFAPARPESVLAAWLLLAKPCLDLLAGRKPRETGRCAPLSRKIVSAPGTSDLVLLRRATDAEGTEWWEPLATGDIPWSAILRAGGWLLVPPDSEGFPAGQKIFAHSFR